MKGESRQSWDAFSYASCARFVSDLGMPVVELLAPKAGERILDVGCGDGFLAQRMQLAGCEVVGIDTSRELVAAARARGVDARVMNAEAMTFGPEFDAVFSNAALHWMRRQDRVIDGAWRAVKPGGRFVVECGGKGNIDGILNGLKKAFARRGLRRAARRDPPLSCQKPRYSSLDRSDCRRRGRGISLRPDRRAFGAQAMLRHRIAGLSETGADLSRAGRCGRTAPLIARRDRFRRARQNKRRRAAHHAVSKLPERRDGVRLQTARISSLG